MHLILRDYLGEGHQLVGAAVGAPDFRRRSRRFSEMGAASPQGIGRRRRAHPYPRGDEGRFAPWCGSTQRVNW